MDAADPPRIVFESGDACPDATAAEQMLDRAVDARAPRPGWLVRVRIASTGPGARQAEGDILSDQSIPVAHRVLASRAPGCEGLARAAGVWASLVLDSERQRTAALPATATATDSATATATATDSATATAPDSTPAPALAHDAPETPRAFEGGIGAFVLNGAGGATVAGGTPFLSFQLTDLLFLRPSLTLGQTFWRPASDSTIFHSSTALSGRVDACVRLPRLAARTAGPQVELCGGADAGVVYTTSQGFVTFGPGVVVREQLAGGVALFLRGAGGLNLFDPGNTGPSAMPAQLSGRLELGVSGSTW
ncbi:MAG TPA: hypothetical protein VIF15_20125 [Polyangiaceae bacterium]